MIGFIKRISSVMNWAITKRGCWLIAKCLFGQINTTKTNLKIKQCFGGFVHLAQKYTSAHRTNQDKKRIFEIWRNLKQMKQRSNKRLT